MWKITFFFFFLLRFVRRLLYFYKPSSKLYANLDLDYAKAKQLTVVGCQFTEFLLESEEVRNFQLEDERVNKLLCATWRKNFQEKVL